MSGASRKHNLIGWNIGGELRPQLRDRDCEAYIGDMRVKVSSTGLYTYPDVVVVCGEPLFEDAEVDTLLNPKVLFGTLSKSTEGYDRGKKVAHYRTLPSLAEHVLVAQDKPHVEHYVRQPDNQWLLSETNRLEDTIALPSIQCNLRLAEIYLKVKFGS
jgi:Uma2 family endonuclease